MSSTTSSTPVICSQCGRDCGSHWTIINGHAVCDFCWPTHQRLCANTDGESCPVAALRSRIATLEGQVGQAREALEEDVGECAAWCDVDKGCLACHRFDTCKKRIALQALREGGENA